jgi:hypothetical protein
MEQSLLATQSSTSATDVQESNQAALSWAAIAAGGFAAAALMLVLLAFGSALGFSSVSPWANSGLSAGAFKIATGLYLIVASMVSSTIGGYIAGRLRTKWVGARTEEVAFRDTAHGFLAWCFATLLGAAALGTAATYVMGGTASPAGQTTSAVAPEYFSDRLLRAAPTGQISGTQATNDGAARREVGVILGRSIFAHTDLPAADRSYLAQLVSSRTGMSQADSERRVGEVVTAAKAAADDARKSAAAASLWLAASMLIGAFSASLAAIEGGQLRDGRWKGVIGGLRTARSH